MRLTAIALLASPALILTAPAMAQTTTAPSATAVPADLAQPATPTAQMLAQADTAAPTAAATATQTYQDGISGYFANWFARSDAAKASQPHWMTPLVTVTPRLEQEVRYDQLWQHTGTGANIDQYDAGKGLELIPTDTNEVLLNPPAYLNRSVKKPAQGYADWGFLTVKQRLASANEQDGNYIVTAFLGVQAPSGDATFTNRAWIVTPTIAGGKGWGDFDIQSTLGIQIPMSQANILGTAYLWNTTFQYHAFTYFWPEFETNITQWSGGLRNGKTQVMLTPGLILGRFDLFGRAKGIIGGGYQFAVTPKLTTTPVLTPLYDHAWIMTARVAF